MPQHPYLTRSGKRGMWRYRRSVPAHLRPLMRKREIIKSLGTSVIEEGLPVYHLFAAETDEALDWAQQEFEFREEERATEAEGGDTIINDMIPALMGETSSTTAHMCRAPEDLEAACERHYEWCRDAEHRVRHEMTKRVNADPAAFWRGDSIALPMSQDEFYALPQVAHLARTGDGYKYLLAMAYAKRLQDGANVLKAKLATQDVEAVAATYGSCTECARKYGLAFIETELRVINDFLTSDAALVPSVASRSVSPTLHKPTAASGPLLSQAVGQWVESGTQGQGAWSAERLALCRRVMVDFIEICGDKGVGDYRKSDGRESIQVLRRLPANLEKRRASLGLQGLGLRKVADIAGQEGLLPQDDSNTNKKIGIADQCFGWIIRQFDECTASPVSGMKLALKRNPREDKDPFNVDQLNAIFAAPVYTGCESERG